MVMRFLGKTVPYGVRAMALTALLLQGSCGIFSPRDSEPPIAAGRTDPLNFSAIMENTRQTFTKLRYEDLFIDNPNIYNDFNSGSYGKAPLIQRLQQIQVQFDSIQVRWQAGEVWTSAGNDTMVLTGLKYYIFTDGNTSGAPGDSGVSNFTVIYNRDWFISTWWDVPASAGKSFFAP
jgi:hypothetical protein